ncbi:sulfotransferase domain-containing protein [Paenibacillus sp. OK003]|uniref:sulfotransferase domain-containing protein n=1 Tax=Paenibacillus sp. OK003 TaxID=1884380 RepID=UPI0008C05144|nr:sulfotransferase domain-containing protein [Paenibacillus sp. OK003]SEK85338.1 Sulfotransferase domain-containing protein [Paenibacillus sp. OK003]
MGIVNSNIEYPRVILNSVPKSGTHLMKQIIEGIPGMLSYPNKFYEGHSTDRDLHYRELQLVPKGLLVTGHVYYSTLWSDMLREMQFKHIFLNRDLRDIVVSYTYFITDNFPSHPLHAYMLSLPSRKEQYLALIQGVFNLQYPSIATWYSQFIGWTREENSLQVHFEQLVGSHRSRRQTMERILLFLWDKNHLPLPKNKILEAMERNINPQGSYTFRRGRIGDWRFEFDEEVKTCFKEVAGHLLLVTGYEADYNW